MDFTEEHRWNMDELKQERLAAAKSARFWTRTTVGLMDRYDFLVATEEQLDFPWNKPSSYWGIAHSWKPPGPTRSGQLSSKCQPVLLIGQGRGAEAAGQLQHDSSARHCGAHTGLRWIMAQQSPKSMRNARYQAVSIRQKNTSSSR